MAALTKSKLARSHEVEERTNLLSAFLRSPTEPINFSFSLRIAISLISQPVLDGLHLT